MSPRVTPRLWMALPAVVLVLALSIVIGPLIADALVPGDSPTDLAIFAAIVLAVLLIVAVPALAALGWLRAVFFERKRVRALVPTLLAFGPVIYFVYLIVTIGGGIGWEKVPLPLILVNLLLAALAGVGEELAFRGVAVITLRAKLGEVWVAVIPAVLFGLVHLINIGSGAPVADTLYQVVYAILYGFTLYAIRRVTGGLIVPIIVHTLNNGLEYIATAAGAPTAVLAEGQLLPNVVFMAGLVLGTIAMILLVRNRANAPQPFAVATPA